MKKRFLAFLIIALAVSGLYAQDTAPKMEIYRTWISLNNEPKVIRGSLYQVSDNAVVVSSAVKNRHYSANRYEITKLHYYTIETIQIRQSGTVRRGARLGAIAGFTVGFLIGNITTGSGDFFTGPTVGVILGVPSAIAGAGVGAIIGSSKITIPINGNTNNFNQNKNKLREYAIIK